MHLGRYIFLGAIVGLAACIWITLMQPRLKEQLGARFASPSPLPSASVEPTPSPAHPTATPMVAGQSSVKISFYGVTLTVTDPISDLVYGGINDGSGNVWAGFTTERLLAKYPACKAGALGTLVRAKATPTPTPHKTPTPSFNPNASPSPSFSTKTPDPNQPFSKTVGGYTYSYRPSYSTCAPDQAGRDALAAARAAVKNGALPTLSNQ